ncbi:hypothetical protein C5O00_06880 [Pukyongia salina]|uniref:IrrE N-terminal-like domain-containing protein n=1 Tax=Pukyongia salina TaxID=2094025 RepID=A0A2S0HW78_9FLAO|nr:hypothetical protein [Pukyongia salina]AVI50912.1 hypothetical protein C5O00_06880 [Pukyongia salina]
MKKLILLFVLISYFNIHAQYWTSPDGITEIASTSINDIAIAKFDSKGNPIIIYNPIIANKLGAEVSAFFRAHEYGHHYLGHVLNQNHPNPNIRLWLTRNAESEADAYAVRYHISMNNINVLKKTYNTFMNQNHPGDRTHLPSRIRAQNIASLYFNITGNQL